MRRTYTCRIQRVVPLSSLWAMDLLRSVLLVCLHMQSILSGREWLFFFLITVVLVTAMVNRASLSTPGIIWMIGKPPSIMCVLFRMWTANE